jgi:hypothetical protein
MLVSKIKPCMSKKKKKKGGTEKDKLHTVTHFAALGAILGVATTSILHQQTPKAK